MRVLILVFIASLLSSFSASAAPVVKQPEGIQKSLLQQVQIRRVCRRGYNGCSFNAYDRRGRCLSHARRLPPGLRNRHRARCHRIFRAAINRCKRKYCSFRPYKPYPYPGIRRDRRPIQRR